MKQSKTMKDMIGPQRYIDAWKRLYDDSILLSATVTVNTGGMIINEWKLTRLNQGYAMTRVEGDAIAIRPLTFWERIKYFRKVILCRNL